jgi:hypothetical protein
MPHAGNDTDLVRFDLHAAASAKSLLPTPELPVDVIDINRHAGWKAGQSGDKELSVGFSCCLEAQHRN